MTGNHPDQPTRKSPVVQEGRGRFPLDFGRGAFPAELYKENCSKHKHFGRRSRFLAKIRTALPGSNPRKKTLMENYKYYLHDIVVHFIPNHWDVPVSAFELTLTGGGA